MNAKDIEASKYASLPAPGTMHVKSLSDYIKLVTRILSGQIKPDEAMFSNIAVGKNFTDDFMFEYKSDEVGRRYKVYSEYIKNRSWYKGVKDLSQAHYVFYRGEDNIKYKLAPSILRNNNLEREDFIYHEIMVRCPEYFKNTTHLDNLVIMQHFGMPTRLLDISSNPLVALYFACQPYKLRKADEPEPDGKVYVFGLRNDQLLYSDSDKALMLSCIPRFSYDDKNKLIKDVYDRLENNGGIGFKLINGNRSYEITEERFYHEITTEQPAFKRKIKPIDLINPVFVKPAWSNPRILKQDGAFVISGLNETEEEAALKIMHYVRAYIFIKGNDKARILHDLDCIGINKATLFPDLQSVGEYLKNL